WCIGSKVERVMKIEGWPVQRTGERSIVLVAVNIKSELERMGAPVVGHHVPPVEIVLDKTRRPPPCAEPAHAGHVDGGNTRLLDRRGTIIQHETHGRFVYQGGREDVRKIQACVVSLGRWASVERRARVRTALAGRHAEDVGIKAIGSVSEDLICPHVPLNAVSW